MKKLACHAFVATLSAGSLLFLAGCGNGNGGAQSETTITVKPADEGSGSEPAAGGESTATASNGSAAPAEGFGTLVGTVSFDGTPPVLAAVVEMGSNIRDAAVCAAATIPDESLVVNDGKIANVCIFLEEAPKGSSVEVPADPSIFDQKGCRFLPHSLFVRAEQELRILNGDPIAHNTHTFPKRNSPFNSIIEVNDRVGATTTYARPEKVPVQVKCDIHAWMVAYHLVLDHPFGAITAADGTFRIEGLPAGDHEFKVWQERSGYLERKLKVTIRPDEETKLDLRYGGDKFASFDGPQPKTVFLSSR
jgi:hypothetical protein